MSDHAWQIFWLVNLLASGSLFAVITVLVLLRGSRELKTMLTERKAKGLHDPK